MSGLYKCLLFFVLLSDAAQAEPRPEPPALLSQTGLYADLQQDTVAADLLSFSPQYPLWSDSSTKRRWIRLPAGSAIDASDPDAWVFPVGTRLWKEFSLGTRMETRMIDRLDDGSWRYLSYVWRADGSDADLAPASGTRRVTAQGSYRIPSRVDCQVCHAGAAVPVLGFSALQLSADRDPLAPHAEAKQPGMVGLNDLVRSGHVKRLPPSLLSSPPRVQAESALSRAVLGYLHANCGHCHNDASDAGVPVGLQLSQRLNEPLHSLVIENALAAPGRFSSVGHGSRASLIPLRMGSSDPRLRMPPLGTERIDERVLALIQRWELLQPLTAQEASP